MKEKTEAGWHVGVQGHAKASRYRSTSVQFTALCSDCGLAFDMPGRHKFVMRVAAAALLLWWASALAGGSSSHPAGSPGQECRQVGRMRPCRAARGRAVATGEPPGRPVRRERARWGCRRRGPPSLVGIACPGPPSCVTHLLPLTCGLPCPFTASTLPTVPSTAVCTRLLAGRYCPATPACRLARAALGPCGCHRSSRLHMATADASHTQTAAAAHAGPRTRPSASDTARLYWRAVSERRQHAAVCCAAAVS